MCPNSYLTANNRQQPPNTSAEKNETADTTATTDNFQTVGACKHACLFNSPIRKPLSLFYNMVLRLLTVGEYLQFNNGVSS